MKLNRLALPAQTLWCADRDVLMGRPIPGLLNNVCCSPNTATIALPTNGAQGDTAKQTL